MRDTQRGRVYSAQHNLGQIFDNARTNPTFTIEGITVTLPPEGKFASLESIQAYVNRVLRHPAVTAEFPHLDGAKILVRRRKGAKAAHYERATQTIAIPDQVGWAMRELVVLHELAHHLSWDQHGPQFVGAFVALLDAVMGPEVALVARMLFSHNNVREGRTKAFA